MFFKSIRTAIQNSCGKIEVDLIVDIQTVFVRHDERKTRRQIETMSGKKICNAGNIYGAILPVYRLKNLSRLIKHVCGKERFEPISGQYGNP